jgi:hypothetical protein
MTCYIRYQLSTSRIERLPRFRLRFLLADNSLHFVSYTPYLVPFAKLDLLPSFHQQTLLLVSAGDLRRAWYRAVSEDRAILLDVDDGCASGSNGCTTLDCGRTSL